MFRIDDTQWATTTYDTGPIGYDDVPEYEWSDDFTLDGLQLALNRFNEREIETFTENLRQGGIDDYDDFLEEPGEL